MSALLITGLKVRLERVLTPQADDINLVLGLGSHTLTTTFIADYIRYEKQNFEKTEQDKAGISSHRAPRDHGEKIISVKGSQQGARHAIRVMR